MANEAIVQYICYSTNEEDINKLMQVFDDICDMKLPNKIGSGWLGYLNIYLYDITREQLESMPFDSIPINDCRGWVESVDGVTTITKNNTTYYCFYVNTTEAWGAHPEIVAHICNKFNARMAFMQEELAMEIFNRYDPERIIPHTPDFILFYYIDSPGEGWPIDELEWYSQPSAIFKRIAEDESFKELWDWAVEHIPAAKAYNDDPKRTVTTKDINEFVDAINSQYFDLEEYPDNTITFIEETYLDWFSWPTKLPEFNKENSQQN